LFVFFRESGGRFQGEKTYHLPLACRLGYSSFSEGGDFSIHYFTQNVPSFPKEGCP
jgi:hypothetical protein